MTCGSTRTNEWRKGKGEGMNYYRLGGKEAQPLKERLVGLLIVIAVTFALIMISYLF